MWQAILSRRHGDELHLLMVLVTCVLLVLYVRQWLLLTRARSMVVDQIKRLKRRHPRRQTSTSSQPWLLPKSPGEALHLAPSELGESHLLTRPALHQHPLWMVCSVLILTATAENLPLWM